MLALAAAEADIVGIIATSRRTRGAAPGTETDAGIAEKVGWLREDAGDRFDDLELAALIWDVVVSDHPESAAEETASRWGLSAEQVLASPYFLIGSKDGIIEQVQSLRDRYGISYLTVFPDRVDTLAPVVDRLAGT